MDSIITSCFGQDTPYILTRPSFKRNPEVQLNVLKLCWADQAFRINTSISDELFPDHVDSAVWHFGGESMNENFLRVIVQNIPDGDKLLSYNWFTTSTERQLDMLIIQFEGCAELVDVDNDDFDAHIEAIMLHIWKLHMEENEDIAAMNEEAEAMSEDEDEVEDDFAVCNRLSFSFGFNCEEDCEEDYYEDSKYDDRTYVSYGDSNEMDSDRW